jgi:hypothetical protein
MATLCDKGACIYFTFPITGGIQMIVVRDGYVRYVFGAPTALTLLGRVIENRERILSEVDAQTFLVAFRRLEGLT